MSTEEAKQWLMSKELWAFLVSMAAAGLQRFFKYEVIDPSLQAELTALIIVLIRLFLTDKPTSLNIKRARKLRG